MITKVTFHSRKINKLMVTKFTFHSRKINKLMVTKFTFHSRKINKLMVTKVKFHSRKISKLINNHTNSLTRTAHLLYVLSGIHTLFKNSTIACTFSDNINELPL